MTPKGTARRRSRRARRELDHALGLIEKIVHESACPVIALIHAPDPDFVREASKRGVFAYITDADAKDWQNSIDIVLRRFTEYHDLEGAFGRRAVTERAKGILMERHSVDESTAFDMLRDHLARHEPQAGRRRERGRRRPPHAPEAAAGSRLPPRLRGHAGPFRLGWRFLEIFTFAARAASFAGAPKRNIRPPKAMLHTANHAQPRQNSCDDIGKPVDAGMAAQLQLLRRQLLQCKVGARADSGPSAARDKRDN